MTNQFRLVSAEQRELSAGIAIESAQVEKTAKCLVLTFEGVPKDAPGVVVTFVHDVNKSQFDAMFEPGILMAVTMPDK